ncbi:hypothetical protein TgHK011_008974 [Trichoderma gracile]|nr:hypothetical protein TgHK011_008974 [Trichoderma gracile]
MLLVRKASAFETQASRIAAPLCGEEPFSSLLGCSLQVTGTCCHRCSPSHPQRSTPARQPEIHLVRANQRARRKAIASQSGLARRAWAPRRQSLAGPALPCEAAGRGSRYRRVTPVIAAPPSAKGRLWQYKRQHTSQSAQRQFLFTFKVPPKEPALCAVPAAVLPSLSGEWCTYSVPSQHKQRFFFFYFFVLNVFFPFFFLSFTTIYDQAVVVFFRSASFFVPSFSHLGRR